MKRGLTQKIEIIAMYAQRCGQLHSMAPWVEASADVVTADTPFSLDPLPPQSLKQPTMTSWTLLSLQTSWAALCDPTTLSSSLLLPPPCWHGWLLPCPAPGWLALKWVSPY